MIDEMLRVLTISQHARMFLTQVNQPTTQNNSSVGLFNRRDLATILEIDSPDSWFDDIQSFAEEELHEVTVTEKFLREISQHPSVEGRAFVELDDAAIASFNSISATRTCLVSVDASSDEFADGPTLSFRCAVSSALEALSLLQSTETSLRQLRNQAVQCGGIWSKHMIDQLASTPSSLDIDSLANAPEEPPERKGTWQYFPLFRTASIPLGTINEFLAKVYAYNDDPEEENPILALLTRLERKSFTQGGITNPRGKPLSSLPSLPDSLLDATPGECSALVKQKLYGQRDLDLDFFILMDQFTISQETVVIGNHSDSENDGALVLVRCRFEDALQLILAAFETGLTFETMADEAAREADGMSPKIDA